MAGARVVRQDSDGRVLVEYGDGSQVWLGGQTGAERRKAFALAGNCETFLRKHGIERCLFVTITFPDRVTPREAQRRFNSYASHVLRDLFTDYIRIIEPTKAGAAHFHLLAAVDSDVRTGFAFKSYLNAMEVGSKTGWGSARHREATREYASTASDALRSIWAKIRETAPAYGVGRCESIPIRKAGTAVASYVGKYIAKGSPHRGEAWKGCRMVNYSRGWKSHSQQFAWVSDGAREWRSLVARIAEEVGAKDLTEMTRKCSRRWAYPVLQEFRRRVEIERELAKIESRDPDPVTWTKEDIELLAMSCFRRDQIGSPGW